MHARPEQCHNCDTPLQGDYCHMCGQEAVLESPTLREFLHEYLHHYVALEGKLWRTLSALLFSPGKLTVAFMRGRRQLYVKPLALYITFSFLFFLLLSLDGPSQTQSASIVQELATSTQPAVKSAVPLRDEELALEVALAEDRTVALSPASVLGIFEKAFGKLSYLVFALLPLYAFWLWLFYRQRGLGAGTHLVFAFHYHAFFFLALLPGQMLDRWLPSLAWSGHWTLLVCWLYLGLSLHHVYAGRFLPQLVRASALMLLHALAVLLAFTCLVLLFGMQIVDHTATTSAPSVVTRSP